ncbi:MAG TPA: hypothetical protein VMT17_13825 [Anaeromyxobacteraceae bacterium]|nr:hypothetical protein [Anaeromyxobacteraceae bacterium]
MALLALSAALAPIRAAGASGAPEIAALDEAFAGAVATYQRGDYEAAVSELEGVVAGAEELPAGPEAEARWSRALLRLAHARATIGRTAAARDALERLLAILPSAEADPELYSPSFRRELERVRGGLEARPRHRLKIESRSGRAEAAVLCHRLGATPAEVALPDGLYRVSISIAGGVLRETVELSSDLTVTLGPSPAAEAAPAELALANPPPKALEKEALLDLAPAAEVRAAPPKGSAWMRPTAWVGTSLAAVAAGLAVWQGVVAGNAAGQARSMVLPDGSLAPGTDPAAYASAVSSYEAARRNAWIAGGTSIAFAASAALLFVFADRGPVEPAPGGAAVRF